jgi:outer membrane lipoprotein-sorting protein
MPKMQNLRGSLLSVSYRLTVLAVALALCGAATAQDDQNIDAGSKTIAAAEKPAAAAKSSSAAQANDEDAIEILRQMEQRYAQVQTVSGTFRQTRVDLTPGFEGAAIKSQADFSLMKPNKFRADYKSPYEATNLITDDSMYRYTKEQKQVEQYKFSGGTTVQDLNYMLLGFGARVEDVLKVYTVKSIRKGVAEGYHGIQLTPRDKKNSGFEYITILITADQNMRPAQFSMEQGGARTTADLDLKNLNIGGSVRASVFQPNWPRGVTVVPLQ